VKEFYISILLDRTKGQNVIMYSTEGGMNIEDVAHDTPEKISKNGFTPEECARFPGQKIAFTLASAANSI